MHDPSGADQRLVEEIARLTQRIRDLEHADGGRQKAEAALRESDERCRTVLESTPVALVIHRGGPLLYANAAAVKLFGATSADELVGKPVFDFVHPDSLELARARAKGITDMGVVAPLVEERLRKLDGTPIDAEVQSASLVYAGEAAVQTAIRDVSDRNRAEQVRTRLEAELRQAQKMESVGRLAGGVAHDFNNMLSVILGHTELALEQVDPTQPIQADLIEIHTAALRSAALTRQLLAFARKQTIAPKVLNLNETVASMLTMLRRLIGEDIDLQWRPGADLWLVKVDPSQLDQILTNLFVNARDAIAGVGKVTIETGNAEFDESDCEAHPGVVPGEFVRLVASDDGCGMDAETRSHLFEPFFTTKGQGQGTGLGLATVYGIVKQNDGFVNVYTEPGLGTTFSIYFPRYVGKDEQMRADAGEGEPVHGQETLLLVEDEGSILSLATTMLERQGYTVVAAHTPGEAIRLAREYAGEIDLLMTDVVMPEMNGRDLARNILSLYPRVRRLFMSGYTADVIAHHGVLDDGVSFIQKPFSVRQLAAKVREALDGKYGQ